MFHTSGEFVHFFGKWGSGRGELKYPRGTAIDQLCLFVIKACNYNIQVFYVSLYISLQVFEFRYHVCLYIYRIMITACTCQ